MINALWELEEQIYWLHLGLRIRRSCRSSENDHTDQLCYFFSQGGKLALHIPVCQRLIAMCNESESLEHPRRCRGKNLFAS
jgi:hypothetical protein